jgi:hypothetical protein
MTVPMDCAISYTAGSVFAICASRAGGEGPVDTSRASLNRGRIFTLLVTIPIGLYYMLRWPDWSWMYLSERLAGSRLACSAGLLTYLVSHEVGYRHARRLVSSGKARRAAFFAATSFASFFVIVIAGWHRFRCLGTFEDFHRGQSDDFFKRLDSFGALGLGITVFFIAALAVSYYNYSTKKKAR